MDREHVLRELTSKEDGLETSRRVYYTLYPLPSHLAQLSHEERAALTAKAQATMRDRTAKLLCLLLEHLEQAGQLSPDEIDELLLGTIDHR